MGEQKVSLVSDQEQMSRFVKQLLNDVKALEYMIENDWFEDDITRIGAEQEMCLVKTDDYKPALIAMEALEKMKDLEWVETELAKFNLEINLTPHELKASCLSILENEILEKLEQIKSNLEDLDATILLTGIMPTLKKVDLGLHNLMPKKRYQALMDAINSQLIGSSFELRLMGIDELLLKHDSPMLEACNTSFQVHLQVASKDFVKMYNIAQVLCAPIMSMAANSPIVFGKRLWHESRIAMFQQALDTRGSQDHMRERSPRVNFGNDWLHKSVLEIYKEDISRFRVLIAGDQEEDSLEMIKKGEVPNLRALQVHNSTVYRWNRPCYGISPNGKPHLRIENRVIPAGPTVLDEMANAALWLGSMLGMADKYDDITEHISFADAKDNFAKAARYGIDTKFTWLNDEKISPCELAINELIPLARAGLEKFNVDPNDIDRYMNVIAERADKHMTGARWQLRAFTQLQEEVGIDEALTILTSSMVENQKSENPVHNWKLPKTEDLVQYTPSNLKVEEFMSTDIFTVQKDDIIEMVAEMMDWRKIRYIPVEETKGNIVGLVTSRLILRYYTSKDKGDSKRVKDVMISAPITIKPDATILDAMILMRDNKIGCLPVVKKEELIGMITETDFLRISARLIERLEK